MCGACGLLLTAEWEHGYSTTCRRNSRVSKVAMPSNLRQANFDLAVSNYKLRWDNVQVKSRVPITHAWSSNYWVQPPYPCTHTHTPYMLWGYESSLSGVGWLTGHGHQTASLEVKSDPRVNYNCCSIWWVCLWSLVGNVGTFAEGCTYLSVLKACY